MWWRRKRVERCYRIVIEIYEPLSMEERKSIHQAVGAALQQWSTTIARWTVNTRYSLSEEVIDQ